ncbi:MAG: NYN domain-containing protein [bacterium]
MFIPKTKRIQNLARLFPEVIIELEKIFATTSNIYLDWQNVIHWQDKLGWHINPRRLKHFFDSFNTIKIVYIYTGTLTNDEGSQESITEFTNLGYKVETKLVKIMLYPINFLNISKNSTLLLQPFVKKPLLSVLDVKAIESINNLFKDLNDKGVFYLKDKKCNFDVEIARDMFLDLYKNNINNFILWSGDSDFVDPINAITKENKGIFIFSTAGRTSRELVKLNIGVFEIKKIKEFICWPREIYSSIKDIIDEPSNLL